MFNHIRGNFSPKTNLSLNVNVDHVFMFKIVVIAGKQFRATLHQLRQREPSVLLQQAHI